jgi:hypothetical protein
MPGHGRPVGPTDLVRDRRAAQAFAFRSSPEATEMTHLCASVAWSRSINPLDFCLFAI